MPKLPVVSGQDVVKALSKIGFAHIRTTGSHAILRKEDGKGKKVIPVPLHRELAKGTLLSIMHQAGLTREEFEKVLG
ncbi:HicA toxin of bacterial toxin-antitoxin [uncultured archaeon]|nr:HicA toxin of bacterial toxin-antitoxin [uncultured archaeon]